MNFDAGIRYYVKRIKYVLLKNSDRLTQAERARLTALFAQADYAELKQVYQAKERLRSIFERPLSRPEAEAALTQWSQGASAQANRFVSSFLQTLERWKGYVVNF